MTVIGHINGQNGQYPVYHLAPSDTSVYYKDSTGRSIDTGLRKTGAGYSTPDGSFHSSDASAVAVVQQRYRNGMI